MEKESTNIFVREDNGKPKKRKRSSKKGTEENKITFEPSKYQKAIFDYIEHGQGNLIIEACSGSGKTTTILHALNLINQDKSVLYAAFNKDIVTTIQKKIGKNRDNISVRTIHSLGWDIVKSYIGYRPYINIMKYSQKIGDVEFRNRVRLKNWKKYPKYCSNVKQLLEFSRCNLCDTKTEIESLVDKYGIEILGNEVDMVIYLMDLGKNDLTSFDYTDFIWLPNTLRIVNNNFKFDYVIIDEVQDVNIAQLNLILKCFKIGTRGIFVGDENQLIYGFTGTDSDSFNLIRSIPNTTSLPLSITYRCPKKVVDFVHRYCETIESAENAIDGDIKFNCDISEVQHGDAIICRNNAPLLKSYSDLIQLGKKPYVLGNDISKSLEKTVKDIKCTKLCRNLEGDGLFPRLYQDLFQFRDITLKEFRGITATDVYDMDSFNRKLDIIQSLYLLSEGMETSEELLEKISSVFSKTKDYDITLTTAHKSKGLEWDNVYVVCNSLFSRKRTKEWEKSQEKNLAYVTYTRTKGILGFISEKGYESYIGGRNNSMISELEGIEKVICQLYSSTPLSHREKEEDTHIVQIKPKRIDLVNNNKKEDEIKTIDNPNRVSLKTKKVSKDKKDDGFVGDLFSLKTHVSNLKK